jgi:hypothetical protein
MLRLNNTGDKYEVGNSLNVNHLAYASLKKYSKEENEKLTKISKIKCIKYK